MRSPLALVLVVARCVAVAALLTHVTAQGTKVWVAPGENSTDTFSDSLLDRLHYSLSGGSGPDGGQLTIVNLDLLPDEQIAEEVESGVQEEFDAVDRTLGENPEASRDTPLPDHRANRQLSPIYQGVYVPDSRFNAFVDGVMINMVAEMRRRRMDPLYFRVHNKGVVEHVSTRRRTAEDTDRRSRAKTGRQAIGGGVIRGLTNIKRFGNAEVQVAGNSTLVRSHYVFGPLDVEMVFETPKGAKTIASTLTALAGHGLAEVSGTATRFMDFIIDSPSDYEIQLQGSRSKRFRRLSKAAILRLVKREGRLELRLMRMFDKGGRKPLPDVTKDGATKGLWPNNPIKPKKESKENKGSKKIEG